MVFDSFLFACRFSGHLHILLSLPPSNDICSYSFCPVDPHLYFVSLQKQRKESSYHYLQHLYGFSSHFKYYATLFRLNGRWRFRIRLNCQNLSASKWSLIKNYIISNFMIIFVTIYIFQYFERAIIIEMKIPYILFFLLSTALTFIKSLCIHDQVIKNQTMYQVNDSHHHQRRLLQGLAYGPLRIYFQYNLTTVPENDIVGKSIRKIMNIIALFWSQTIQIDYLPALSFEITPPYDPTNVKCMNYNVNESLIKSPIPNKDFGIFVEGEDDGDNGVTAFSYPCSYSTVNKRPLWGFIHWNKQYLTFNPINFQQNLHIGIHQILHVLGFSQMLYSNYKNSNIFVTTNGGSYLNGPYLKKQLIRQYNCPNPPGMTLESGGGQGTAFSHWSRKVASNELMTAGVSVNNPTISYITLALLQQTGWYRRIYKDLGRFINYGYKKGCSLLDVRDCGSNQYCTKQDEKRPDYDRTALGYCKNDSLSNCLYVKFYVNFICTDPNYAEKSLHADQGVVNITGQKGGMKSRCYFADLRITGQPATKYAFRCYQTICSATGRTITLRIGSKLAFCMFPNQVLTINGYDGTLRCPDSFLDTCAVKRCMDQCNANGICLGGRCLCDPNFVGPACSQPKTVGFASKVEKIISSNNKNCMAGSYRTEFGDCQPCDKGCAKCNENGCELCLGDLLPLNNKCKI